MKHWYTSWYVILMLLVSGVAIAMAGLVFLLLPESGEIIRLMQWRMVRANSFRFEVQADYSGQKTTINELGAAVHVKQAIAVKAAGAMDRNVKAGTSATAVEPRTVTGFSVNVGDHAPTLDFVGELRHIKGTDYLNFSTLPEHMGSVPLADFVGKWLTFNLDALRRRIDLPFFGAADKPMSDVDAAQLIEQLRLTPFLTFEGKIGTEKVNGASTWHYRVMPEVLFIKDYAIRYEQTRLNRELTSRERNAVDKFFANVTAEDSEIWIGRGDYYLYRALTHFRYDDGVSSGTFALTVNFTGFNQPLDLRVPDGNKLDVSDIAASLLPGIVTQLPLAKDNGGVLPISAGTSSNAPTGGLPMSGTNEPSLGNGDADNDGLTDTLEYFYHTDPHNPDTDGDGVSDGDEVKQGRNPNGPGFLFDFGLGN